MSIREVEAVWLFKYGVSDFKALYGRSLSGANSAGYTKDFLQVSGECRQEFERVIGRTLVPLDEEPFEYKWPGGGMSGGKIRHTTDRLNLRWPSAGDPPAPWRMASGITPKSLETFEGNPGLTTVQAANQEWARFDNLHQDPWLVVVKLKGEAAVLHLRAYLGNPPPRLAHCSTSQLPSVVRTKMAVGSTRCRIVPLSSSSTNSTNQHENLWFDTDRNHDAFLLSRFALLSDSDPELQSEGVQTLLVEDVNRELAELSAKLDAPPQLTDGFQPVVRQVSGLPRSAAFRAAVRAAYTARCAMCGSELRGPNGAPESQAAHIYPKALDGSDDPRNGLCLCRRHHWAFDEGWLSVNDDFTVVVRPDLPEGDDYEFIHSMSGVKLRDPIDDRLRPAPLYLFQHRKRHGFEANK